MGDLLKKTGSGNLFMAFGEPEVKVKQVKMLNMPRKRRDLGKHPGFKSGFKKAVVVLEEGYAIGQAKP